jgi:hypothetical protein
VLKFIQSVGIDLELQKDEEGNEIKARFEKREVRS